MDRDGTMCYDVLQLVSSSAYSFFTFRIGVVRSRRVLDRTELPDFTIYICSVQSKAEQSTDKATVPFSLSVKILPSP